MKQIGIFNITGDSVDVVPEREDVVYWRATKGSDQSGDVFGPLVEHVASTVDRTATDRIETSGIWRGLSEAVANTIDHAYHGDRGDGFGHSPSTRWWMFTQIRDGVFTAAVCDLGIGYRRRAPTTIPQAFRDAVGEALLGHNQDAKAIETAMRYGTTSTGKEHRGKGSRDAVSVLRHHGQGELVIVSNSGGVIYRLAKNQQNPQVKSIDLGVQALCTIVWWKLPISE